jgi:hypothetical protein
MSDSILTSIKKNVGLPENYTAFDPDIILYINSVFSTLKQLGVGPDAGFSIEDDTAEWVDYLGADLLDFAEVRTYITLRVRMLFDPPQSSFHVSAMQEQIREHEWRLNVTRENVAWEDPTLVVIEDPVVVDGGGP